MTAGSIVNIAVHQNHAEEKKRDDEFWSLQDEILETFGKHSPEPPKLNVCEDSSACTSISPDAGFSKLRNVTQTSITLEWSSLELATSKLRSLDIYKNRQRLASIPNPLQNTSTKLSGLELDTEYSIQLVLRTTGGTFPSNLVRVKTHTTTNTSGIRVCFGTIQDTELLESAEAALEEMGAGWSNKIQIDTTHFVCTTPAATPTAAQTSGGAVGVSGPGVEYQRALQLSIPIVQPQWILACLAEKRWRKVPFTSPRFSLVDALSFSDWYRSSSFILGTLRRLLHPRILGRNQCLRLVSQALTRTRNPKPTQIINRYPRYTHRQLVQPPTNILHHNHRWDPRPRKWRRNWTMTRRKRRNNQSVRVGGGRVR